MTNDKSQITDDRWSHRALGVGVVSISDLSFVICHLSFRHPACTLVSAILLLSLFFDGESCASEDLEHSLI
jgi:hypothetical protein